MIYKRSLRCMYTITKIITDDIFVIVYIQRGEFCKSFGFVMTLKQNRNITVSNLSVSCFNLNIKFQDDSFRSKFYPLHVHTCWLHISTHKQTTILAKNTWDSVANVSLPIASKTKERKVLALPSFSPSINVASFHRVRCWLGHVQSEKLTKNSQR